MKPRTSRTRLLTPEEALGKILRACPAMQTVRIALEKACGLVLAEDVRAADSLPRFDNSAMDGFAARTSEIRRASSSRPVALRIAGEVRAGSRGSFKLKTGTAVRISTGAPMPRGADAVVRQEDASVRGATVWIRLAERAGGNVRRKGEEIRRGQTALKCGTRLNAGSLAWLASMGISKVKVFRLPRVGLLRSGDEVVEPGTKPREGQIRDAHGVSLRLALRPLGIEPTVPPIVHDRSAQVVRSFRKLLAHCDIVLTTGGVSVGQHDLFREAARRLGVREIFHKVAQKPGKPLVAGRRKHVLWLGLPGNPVSSLVCFHLYVKPALLKMAGHAQATPEWFEAHLSRPYRASPKRTEFLRGKIKDGIATPAQKQGSHCLGGFAGTDALIRIDPSSRLCRRIFCCRL